MFLGKHINPQTLYFKEVRGSFYFSPVTKRIILLSFFFTTAIFAVKIKKITISNHITHF